MHLEPPRKSITALLTQNRNRSIRSLITQVADAEKRTVSVKEPDVVRDLNLEMIVQEVLFSGLEPRRVISPFCRP